MLDAIPKSLKLRAMQHGLPSFDCLSLVGVLDFQFAGQLA
jgi:hypothetical protein